MCIEIHFHILDFHTYIFMWMVYPQITSPLFQQIMTPPPLPLVTTFTILAYIGKWPPLGDAFSP